MRKVVESYNEMMQRHHVDVASLRKPIYLREHTNEHGEVSKEVIPIGPEHMFTYRVFRGAIPGLESADVGVVVSGRGSQRNEWIYVKTSTLMVKLQMK